jgi:transposase InsO family protein
MAQTKRSTLQGAIFHSDRGIQYASKQFKAKLQAYGMKQSMSAKGNCYDNAVAESFFHTLKMEMVHHETFKTKKEAMEKIKLYIEFYNRNRMHSYNNYLTPMEAEMRWWQNNQKIQYVA